MDFNITREDIEFLFDRLEEFSICYAKQNDEYYDDLTIEYNILRFKGIIKELARGYKGKY